MRPSDAIEDIALTDAHIRATPECLELSLRGRPASLLALPVASRLCGSESPESMGRLMITYRGSCACHEIEHVLEFDAQTQALCGGIVLIPDTTTLSADVPCFSISLQEPITQKTSRKSVLTWETAREALVQYLGSAPPLVQSVLRAPGGRPEWHFVVQRETLEQYTLEAESGEMLSASVRPPDVPLSPPTGSSAQHARNGVVKPAKTFPDRTVFVVAVDDEASWRDMAALAAVPAAAVANTGRPVVLFAPVDELSGSVARFLEQYQAGVIYSLGVAQTYPVEPEMSELGGDSAVSAANILAGRFWPTSSEVVLANEADYASALCASALAGRLAIPLLFFDDEGLEEETAQVLQDLECNTAAIVGSAPSALSDDLLGLGIAASLLESPAAVAAHLQSRGSPVEYVAMTNVRDRTDSTIRALSLLAPQIAAYRCGVVLPLDFDTVWKTRFDTSSVTNTRPAGAVMGTKQLNAWRFATDAPVLAPGFPNTLYPVNGNYGHGETSFGRFSSRGFCMVARQPSLAAYDAVVLDVDNDDVYEAGELFIVGDSFALEADLSFSVTGIQGNGRWWETGGSFTVELRSWRVGAASWQGAAHDFIETSVGYAAGAIGWYDTVQFDLNDNGAFNDSGEGPFLSGDIVHWADRDYAITVGTGSGWMVPGDLKLTYPTAAEIVIERDVFCQAAGISPEYLCIVGWYDAVPFGIVHAHDYSDVDDIPTDLLYANTDEDIFAELAVGRIIGKTVYSASAIVARTIAYTQLLEPGWAYRVVTFAGSGDQAGIAKTVSNHLERLGYDPPVEFFTGKSFSQGEMQDTSVIFHFNHAGSSGWSNGPSSPITVPLAPCIAESGGCYSAGIDLTSPANSIALAFFEAGAVAYLGNTRPASNPIFRYIGGVWDTLLTGGQSLGQAHRAGQNIERLRLLHEGRTTGSDHVALHEAMLYGDPAFRLPRYQTLSDVPAQSTFDTASSTLTVTRPETWLHQTIPCSSGSEHLYTGSGVFFDDFIDSIKTVARLRVYQPVSAIVQQSTSSPLGWPGSYFLDAEESGALTYQWLARLLAYTRSDGTITAQTPALYYTVTAPAGDSIPPNAVQSLRAKRLGGGYYMLWWTPPEDVDFAEVRLIRRTGQLPAGVTDPFAQVVYQGNDTQCLDWNLAADSLHWYSVYAFDTSGNVSPPVSCSVSAEGEGEGTHTADQDGDHRINMSELLRVIQFYNLGGYHCQTGTEDGYTPGAGSTDCAPHASDYNPIDWTISMSELLRLIQFYNSGGYHECPGEGTEDGYCPGLSSR